MPRRTPCDFCAGACAHGLVRVHHADAPTEPAEMLADPESPARIAAAHAIAYADDDRAAPLLRFKVLTGDIEPAVVGECLAALLAIAPDPSLDFVARVLDGDDADRSHGAALALGGSKLPAASLSRDWWERTSSLSLRRTASFTSATPQRGDERGGSGRRRA